MPKTLDKKTFGDRIRQLRRSLPGGLSQEQFGSIVGWSMDKVRNIENGRAACREEYYWHLHGCLVDEFGMTINADWWNDGDGPPLISATPGLEVHGVADQLLEYRNEQIRNLRDLVKLQREKILLLEHQISELESKGTK
nr:hypothetical protein 23 [bacterium]